jgi:tRNA(Ile)-lysidine synthase
MGHTADDVAEAGAMRAAGGTTPSPREWAPSPVWPDGREVFVLRPLLSVRRAALREWLTQRGEAWIEDPANEDPRFARGRARALLKGVPAACEEREDVMPRLSALALQCSVDPAGLVRIARSSLREAAPDAARAFLSIACVCAGGGGRPPRGAATARLLDALAAQDQGVATLAGAAVRTEGADVLVCREAGDIARRNAPPLALEPGGSQVWDGRYEFSATAPGLAVRPLAGVARSLSPEQRAALGHLDARARGAAPVVAAMGQVVGCPVVQPVPGVQMRCLVGERLRAACGVVDREPA